MNVGLVIIGTELLTGKRSDRHLPTMIDYLAARGMEVSWCHYLGDDPARLVQTLALSMESGDLVFSFGGIGATPDDHTRAAAADASGRALTRHPELSGIIEERFGADAYPQRIRMADLPEGCSLIPNPVNRIAGFSVGDHHFVPGFPQMAWPMVEWVLDTKYKHLQGREVEEAILAVPNTGEGALVAIMEALLATHPLIQLSCLPHMDGDYRETELGVRGEPKNVAAAYTWLQGALKDSGFPYVLRTTKAL